MQPTQRHMRAFCAVMIGQRIRTISRGDVYLNHDQIGVIVEGQVLDVFVFDHGLIRRIEITRQRSQSKRGKERIFD
jgi:hypothetical protein